MMKYNKFRPPASGLRKSGGPEQGYTVNIKLTLAQVGNEVLKFWHPTKNSGNTPSDFNQTSHESVWWKCEKGHEWVAKIIQMRYRPKCPICFPSKGTSKDNNLEVKSPALARLWHPTKNGEFLPSQLTPFSTRMVWWQCKKGHEWNMSPAVLQQKKACPFCYQSKREKKLGKVNLAENFPQIASLWHPVRNGSSSPADFNISSSFIAWWRCEKGHEWQRRIFTMKTSPKCPICRKIEYYAENNLQLTNPELAAEWHPDKNGGLTPDKILSHVDNIVWWRCPQGHEFQASVNSRNRASNSFRCPFCYGHRKKTIIKNM